MIFCLPVKPRTSRSTAMQASVPVFAKRTRSAHGIISTSCSATSISTSVAVASSAPPPAPSRIASTSRGCAWPWMREPYASIRSRYRLPSTSTIVDPSPRSMKSGYGR